MGTTETTTRRTARWASVAAAAAMLTAAFATPAFAHGAEHGSASPDDPPGCERGCQTVFSQQLSNGQGELLGLRTTTPDGMVTSFVAYRYAGEWVDTTAGAAQPHGLVQGAECAQDASTTRCTLATGVGAHSVQVDALALSPSTGIQRTDRLTGATPGYGLADLNQDGQPDAAVEQSTYDPDYAEAPQFWQTALQQGGKFTITGCTSPVQDPGPAPTAPVHGACATP